jgi:hypothetical protein
MEMVRATSLLALTTRELSVLGATREALVLRLPARARRRTARIIARL